MENVARRKIATVKDKSELIEVGTELPSTPPMLVRRSWLFFLLFGCVFIVITGLLTHRSSNVAGASSWWKANFTVKFQELSEVPAFALEDFGRLLSDVTPSISVQDAVVFPDNVMLLVKVSKFMDLESNISNLECRFGAISPHSSNATFSTSPVISIRRRTKDLQMVRCPRPNHDGFPSELDNSVALGVHESDAIVESNAVYDAHRLPSWEALVYEGVIDTDNLVLLAKGLVSKSSKKMDVNSLVCVFGAALPSEIVYETPVVTAAQEVIRCQKPPVHLDEKLRGYRVSVKASWLGVLPSVTYYSPENNPEFLLATFLNSKSSDVVDEANGGSMDEASVAVHDVQTVGQASESALADTGAKESSEDDVQDVGGMIRPKRKLCGCTMVWNKAKFLREWIVYHSFLGVEKYFIYDNDSDDSLDETLGSLQSQYNISKIIWPWIKTQQAAFSHCTILAKEECEWMMFTDVDEFIYPFAYLHKEGSEQSDALTLQRMIDDEGTRVDKTFGRLGQIQYDCHNFGPSALKSTPKQGVTVGYTCRMRNPERHKSIILLDAVNASLLNVLHHFELREGFQSIKIARRRGVVNHYKFQAWDAFQMKFMRRAGTYTTEWTKSENTGSKDRTPGLGTEAVKPPDWESRFCQVHDRGLRDFALRTFATESGALEWQLEDLPPLER